MRDGTILQKIAENNKAVIHLVNSRMGDLMMQLLDYKIYLETIESIIYSRWSVLKFLLLLIFMPNTAKLMFAEKYTDVKVKHINAMKEELKCSDSSKKAGTLKEDSPKEILVPNKKILGADGRPLSSK